MTLLEALEILKEMPPPECTLLHIHLACGFTPEQFLTFLKAHLRQVFPDHCISVSTGLFGDLAGNLRRLETERDAAIMAIIEWQDLDPRLGIRLLGGWRPSQLADIVAVVSERAATLSETLIKLAGLNNITLALPSLPLPPVAFAPGWLTTSFETKLRESVATLASSLSHSPGIRMVSSQRLDRLSPHSGRFDVKSELRSGFPYTLNHADKLTNLLAQIIRDEAPKKGLITDLDNTLWQGILGEVGLEGISWDLDHHAQKHGLYQQMLASISEAGALVGVASKNDPALVEAAFQKTTPILSKSRIFPLEVNWGPKSASVTRILETWNINADSVVFVDDSPMELAEVQNAHPSMDCLLFPGDDRGAYEFVEHLRDLFGKSLLSAEDKVRLESIKASRTITEQSRRQGYTPDQFLQEAGGKLTVSFGRDFSDSRTLELINKTNQFNLNGERHTETSWRQYLRATNVFLLTASYEDKFGPLGKIAVMTGRTNDQTFEMDHWVMSCRAFSRRIEHACLLHVFQKLNTSEAVVRFVPTARNGPIQNFFAEILASVPEGKFLLSKRQFLNSCPPVYLRIQELSNE